MLATILMLVLAVNGGLYMGTILYSYHSSHYIEDIEN